jgi:serine/threonine protein kinase
MTLSLPLSPDHLHDAEGLPIPGSYNHQPTRPDIVTGDEGDLQARLFMSPDLNQKVPQPLRAVKKSHNLTQHNVSGFDFFRPVSLSYDVEDLSMSPVDMFLTSCPVPSAPPRSPDSQGEFVSGYKLGPVVAYGGFSTIRSAESATGGIVAVKIVRRSDIVQQKNPSLVRKRLDHEAAVWISLSHEHILPLFSAVHTPYADFFITLYCPAGSLFDVMKRDGRPALPSDDAVTIFRQVVRGLQYLHEVARLVHRDIKLENVLVDEMGVWRIGDFGMSRNIGELDVGDEKMQHQEDRETFVQAKQQTKSGHPAQVSGGTTTAELPQSLPYAAPELLTPTPVPADPAQDIWALGVMFYALLAGQLPFSDTFDPRLRIKILHGEFFYFHLLDQRY